MIPIQNVYYMLSYAFRVLNEQGYKSIATEEFHNVAELCASILTKGVSLQLKRGLGKEYICSVLGVWNNVNEIDIASLPKQFVLKTTHGGGNEGVVVCKDKDELDWDAAKAKLRENMKENIYDSYREWPYKNVERRIFAEKYLGDNILDYKFYCCNGYDKSRRYDP